MKITTPISASEIGRRLAPDGIKDRAGWGRKWVARNKADLIEHDGGLYTTLTLASRIYATWLFLKMQRPRVPGYKAPHAPRGTPMRVRHARLTPKPLCNH